MTGGGRPGHWSPIEVLQPVGGSPVLYALWGTHEYVAWCGTQFRWPPEVTRRTPVGDLDAIIDREYWLADNRKGG